MTVDADLVAAKEHAGLTEAGSRFLEIFRALQRQTGSLVPPRQALTLSIGRAFVPYMSVLEVRGPRDAVFRMIGTGHVDRTRMDNTGKNWFDLADPSHHELHWQHFRRVLDTPCGCIGHFPEKYDKSLAIEAINLPFADREGRASFLVSTNVQMSLDDLILRGESSMVPGDIKLLAYLDIGAGIGNEFTQ